MRYPVSSSNKVSEFCPRSWPVFWALVHSEIIYDVQFFNLFPINLWLLRGARLLLGKDDLSHV